MGTIRKVLSGKWNVQIRRKGHRNLSKTFSSRTEAIHWMRRTESDMEHGSAVTQPESSAESLTLADALNRYLVEVTQFV
jgi:hypothetical protein